MIAQLIQAGKATLRELRECYSLKDLFDMWEVVHLEHYNNWLRNETLRKEREMRRR